MSLCTVSFTAFFPPYSRLRLSCHYRGKNALQWHCQLAKAAKYSVKKWNSAHRTGWLLVRIHIWWRRRLWLDLSFLNKFSLLILIKVVAKDRLHIPFQTFLETSPPLLMFGRNKTFTWSLSQYLTTVMLNGVSWEYLQWQCKHDPSCILDNSVKYASGLNSC